LVAVNGIGLKHIGETLEQLDIEPLEFKRTDDVKKNIETFNFCGGMLVGINEWLPMFLSTDEVKQVVIKMYQLLHIIAYGEYEPDRTKAHVGALGSLVPEYSTREPERRCVAILNALNNIIRDVTE
jgi:hypothetical protein